ncbi:hypothetical protein EGW08_001016 [Elysia chlorotica]|uniref:Sodium/solute symporter n=1 Tax=Elysia chlorotica TaxID=188477 RepID=A0A3S1BTH6_ELYCH|nr:hypothetical protein EGW08_001016 [Elysia chlorotica]
MVAENVTETTPPFSHQFHVIDYVVFGVTIFISLGIGVFHAIAGRRKNNTTEYILGGRSLGFIPTAISLIASFESSIMMLGLPAEAYLHGFQFVWWIVGMCLSQLLAINVVVPLIHPLGITSAYEYLERRFDSKAVRLVGTALGTISYSWYMGVVLFGPAVALEAVAGYPIWNSIVVICGVSVIYTSIGGIRAVIWTDVFQGLVMLTGVFAILIQGTLKVGGPKKVWDVAKAGGRLNFFNFDLDPRVRHTFWSLCMGSLVRGFGLLFNQSAVQRISSTRTMAEAKKMLMITSPFFLVTMSIATYEGVVSYAYYQTKGCDPLASGQISNPNQIVPYTVMDIFSRLRGMPGLFLASLFSASLRSVFDNKSTVILKLLVVFFGAVACAVSFVVAEIGGTLIQIGGTLISAFSGPLTGIFFLGCFVPRSNAKVRPKLNIHNWGMWPLSPATSPVGLFVLLRTPYPVGLTYGSRDRLAKFISTIGMKLVHSCSIVIDPIAPRWAGGEGMSVTTAASAVSAASAASAVSAALYLNKTQNSPAPGPKGVEVIYTLSYQYISALGVFSTMIVGTIVSVITGMNKPGDVDPRYLISVSESLLFFLPAPVRRWVSSLGPQYMDDIYRLNKCHIVVLVQLNKCHILVLVQLNKCHIMILVQLDKCHIKVLVQVHKCHTMVLVQITKCHIMIMVLVQLDKCGIMSKDVDPEQKGMRLETTVQIVAEKPVGESNGNSYTVSESYKL